MIHYTRKQILKNQKVGLLIASDFGGTSVRNLEESELFQNPQALNDFLEGIKTPVTIMVRRKELIIADGHHRAWAAYRTGLNLPAEVIYCFCRELTLKPCAYVKSHVSQKQFSERFLKSTTP